MLSCLFLSRTQTWCRFALVCISVNVFVLCLEHTPADMVCVFRDTLQVSCSPRTECLTACFRISVKMGHGALELNSSASTTKGTELQLLIKRRRSQQRNWHTMAASNMTCRINYGGSLITVPLMRFIILSCLFTDPHAVWCLCRFQFLASYYTQPQSSSVAGHTRPLCCFHLYN